MNRRNRTLHTPSLLIGMLIGAIGLLILLVAIPGPRAAAHSSTPATTVQLQARLDQAVAQLKTSWGHFVAGLNSHSSAPSPTATSCLQFRAWFNQMDDKLVAFLAQHKIHLARWQLSMSACSSVAAGPGRSG